MQKKKKVSKCLTLLNRDQILQPWSAQICKPFINFVPCEYYFLSEKSRIVSLK